MPHLDLGTSLPTTGSLLNVKYEVSSRLRRAALGLVLISGILVMFCTITCVLFDDGALVPSYIVHLMLEAVEIAVLIALTLTLPTTLAPRPEELQGYMLHLAFLDWQALVEMGTEIYMLAPTTGFRTVDVSVLNKLLGPTGNVLSL
jgi:hypothetical protein